MGIDAHITAAGDNQVMLVRETEILSGSKLQGTIERIKERSAKAIGHKTKPEETFTSRTITEFNKNTFIYEKKASQGSMKCSQIGTESDEIIPSINSQLTCIYSTGVAAAAETESPRGKFLIAIFESILAIMERVPDINEQCLLSILLYFRALGGLKVNLYPSFLC